MDVMAEVNESSTIDNIQILTSTFTPEELEEALNTTQLAHAAQPHVLLMSDEALYFYFAFINGAGIILNLLVVFNVFRKRLNDILFILVQIVVSDLFVLTIVSVPELWSHRGGPWIFGDEACSLYLGAEVFTNTSGVYFIVFLACHIITVTTVNLSLNTKGELEEDLLEDATEMKSSRHSLVSRNEHSSARSDETDIKNKRSIKTVILPVLLIWILSISVSVPEFVLAVLLRLRLKPSLCTFINGNRTVSMQILLFLLELAIPFFVMIGISALIIRKIRNMRLKRKKTRRNTFELLKLSLFLMTLYIIFSVPRSCLIVIHIILGGKYRESEGLDQYKIPPLNNATISSIVPLVLSFLHFLSPVIRPLAYAYFLRHSNTKLLFFNRFLQRRAD